MASNTDNSDGVKRVRKRKPAAASGSPGGKRKAQRITTASEEIVVSSTEAPKSRGGLGPTSVSFRDVTTFLRQFIMLQDAGTPILKSLKTLSLRTQRRGLQALVTDICQYVEAGNPLWQAFERHPKHFSPVFVNSIKASEASGTLVTVMRRNVKDRERREIMRMRLFAALLYPFVLVAACLAVMLIITKVVVPVFVDMFEQADLTLPWYSERFIGVSNFVGNYWWVGLLIIVGIYAGYKLWWVRNPLRRLMTDRLKLRVPLLGTISQKNAIIQMCRTMALLLRSGISMMATLDLTRRAITNTAVANVLVDVRDSVERGEGLEEPLRGAEGVIPNVVADMLVTGEEAGQLDQVADQLAEVYEEEVEIAVDAIGEALQPAITLVIGAMVAMLFVALFLPLLSMLDQLGSGAGV